MQLVGKSKIGSLSARKGIRYPQLRLPQQCADVIGHTADIFETESEGKRAFLIVTDQAVPNGDSVLKQSEEVLKPVQKNDANARLSALESEIKDLKSLLLLNESDNLAENRKQKAEGEIRTRVVASTGP
jgi:hypothetical protein